jgi:hypothetical protein
MPLTAENETFLVLNGAHLKKMATVDALAAAVGASPEVAQRELAEAVRKGWAMELEGRYLLMPEGTAAVHSFYSELHAQLRGNPAIEAWYASFETMNDHFIKAVSDWQKDEEDERAKSKVLRVVERLVKALNDVVPLIPRYGRYARRFREGIGRVDRGERDYVCGPSIDSIHTVWFEFHEDILSVLGRPRDV